MQSTCTSKWLISSFNYILKITKTYQGNFFNTQKVHCAIHEILQNKNKIKVEFNLSSNYKLNYFQPFACFTPNIDKTHHSLYIPQYTVSTSHGDGWVPAIHSDWEIKCCDNSHKSKGIPLLQQHVTFSCKTWKISFIRVSIQYHQSMLIMCNSLVSGTKFLYARNLHTTYM